MNVRRAGRNFRSVRWAVLVSAIACGTGFQPAASQVTDGGATNSAAPSQPAKIDALIEQLGDPSYEVREAADAELREIGIAAADALARTFQTSDDYEKRLRVQGIAEHVYFWDRVLGKNGFLGISHRKYGPMSSVYDPHDPRIPPGISAFAVEAVIEGTSAQRDGLRRGDIIISVNGNTLPEQAELTDFADQIRDKPPGTEMVFEFWRGSQLLTKRIKIGSRPPEYYLGNNVPEDLKRQFQAAVEKFPEWWVEHFGPWQERLESAYDEQREIYLPVPPVDE